VDYRICLDGSVRERDGKLPLCPPVRLWMEWRGQNNNRFEMWDPV